jgi:hypothetical protein
VQLWQEELLPTDGIDLFLDDRHHLGPHPLTEWQHRVHTGRELTHVSASHEQLVTYSFSIGWIVTKCGDEGF